MRTHLLLFVAFVFLTSFAKSQVPPSNVNSLELSGSNFISLPDDNSLDLNTNTTFEGWFNFCSSGMIFSKNFCVYEAGYYLSMESSGAVKLLAINSNVCNSGPTVNSATPTTYSFNEWHHFALTVSVLSGNSQFQLFMDHHPTPVINLTVNWVTNNNSEPLRIGTYRAISGSFGHLPQGRICDFRVYDHLVSFNDQCLANPSSVPLLRLEMQSGNTSTIPNTGLLSTSLSGTNLTMGNTSVTPNYLSTSPLFDPVIQTNGPFSISDIPTQFLANPTGGTWSANCGTCMSSSGLFNPASTGAATYQICYTIGSGVCSEQDCKSIVIDDNAHTTEDYTVFIPNIFTPNNDHINDFFLIDIDNGFLAEGFIVNRWGNIIKEFHENDLTWDGKTSDGTIVSDGVYTYIFVVTNTNGINTKYNGFVTVIR